MDTQKTRLIDFASCGGCAAKFPPQTVSKVLSHLLPYQDPRVLVATETHDDAGVFQIAPDIALVQTIDFFPPVVDSPYIYGQIAAANALSDVYAMGGTPISSLNMVCYPDHRIDLGWLGEMVKGGSERMAEARCSVLGGHSVRDEEIKFGYAVTGTIHPKKIFTNATATPGDVLILTKGLGTGCITTAHKREACDAEIFRAACESMIQLNEKGRDAMIRFDASAATDVTGFGLSGHSLEMALGAGVTLEIHLKSLPLLPGALEIASGPFLTRASKTNREYVEEHLSIEAGIDEKILPLFFDPQTSGGLLISVAESRSDALLAFLMETGHPRASVIGRVLPKESKLIRLI